MCVCVREREREERRDNRARRRGTRAEKALAGDFASIIRE